MIHEAIADASWAGVVADKLGRWVEATPKGRLCLPTGRTVEPVYSQFEGSVLFGGSTIFLLDEFGGLPAHDPGRCESMIRRSFLDKLGSRPELHLPHVDGDDPDVEATRYDSLISAGGLDLVLLGLGTNGHVGMNEPGSTPDSPTRAVALAQSTQDNAIGYGATSTPTWGVTIGMDRILESKAVWLLVTGEHKAEILKRTLEGPMTSEVPASLLKSHPGLTVLSDRSASPA